MFWKDSNNSRTTKKCIAKYFLHNFVLEEILKNLKDHLPCDNLAAEEKDVDKDLVVHNAVVFNREILHCMKMK